MVTLKQNEEQVSTSQRTGLSSPKVNRPENGRVFRSDHFGALGKDNEAHERLHAGLTTAAAGMMEEGEKPAGAV